MAYRLGGRNSLPYLGVEAPTPANTVLNRRSPTSTDSQNFNIGTWWLKTDAHNEAEEVWILISLSGGVATWVQLYPSGGGGASEFPTDSGVANELAGVLNIFGGAGAGGFININTEGSGNTVQIKLNDTIQWPNTDPGLTEGAIFLGGDRFMHNLGDNSTFLGALAGPLSNSSDSNTGIGFSALNMISTGLGNTVLGSLSGTDITSGDSNLLLGVNSGSVYTTENNNINLSNSGTASDSGVIRLGNNTDHQSCFISGIYNKSIGSTNAPVFIDNTGKLGTSEGGVSLSGSSFMGLVAPASETLNIITGTFAVGSVQAMTVLYDNFSGAFNPGNGSGTGASFTAPISGYYELQWNCLLNNGSNATAYSVNVVINGTLFFSDTTGSNVPNFGSSNVSMKVHLNATDVVTFTVTIISNPGSTNPVIVGGNGTSGSRYESWISGVLLKTS